MQTCQVHRMAESVTFGNILTAHNAISEGSIDCNVWVTHPLQTSALGTCVALAYSPQVPKTALEQAHQEAEGHVELCNDITACISSTYIAFADASFRHCGKANAATPTKALCTALGQRCHVFAVDACRTSALCWACKHRMRGVPLPTALGETTARHHSEISWAYSAVSTCACT